MYLPYGNQRRRSQATDFQQSIPLQWRPITLKFQQMNRCEGGEEERGAKRILRSGLELWRKEWPNGTDDVCEPLAVQTR